MGFLIPDEVNATFGAQAEPDSVDYEILAAADIGTGKLFGSAVTAQVVPDMTVAVAAGTVAVAQTVVTVVAGTVAVTAADPALPRFDLVVVDNAGVKSVVAGTPAVVAVFPPIPANSVVLAAVYVPAAAVSVTAGQIVDKRAGASVSKAGDTMTGALTVTRPATVSTGLVLTVTGEAVQRLKVTADGTMLWGDGAGGGEVSLQRSTSRTLSIFPADGQRGVLTVDSSSSTAGTSASLDFRRSEATATVVTTNDRLGNVRYSGWDGAIYGVGVEIRAVAAELFSGAAHGSFLDILTTPTASITSATRMRIASSGTVEIGSTGAPGTVEKLRVSLPATVDNLANTILVSSAATNKPLVVQGFASQSGFLFEAQSSAGASLASISSDGAIVSASTVTGTAGIWGTTPASAGTVRVPNAGFLRARNAANNADIDIVTVNSNNVVQLGAPTAVNSSAAPGTAEKFRVNTPTTVDNTGITVLSSLAATESALIVQANVTQTTPTFKIMNSAGVSQFTVSGVTGTTTWGDPSNLAFGTVTGTKIGTATNQKLAFFNATPIIQPAAAAQAAVAATAATNVTPFGFTTAAQADAIVTLVNRIRTDLVALGLIKGSA